MRREASADQCELAGRRIIHRQMAVGLLQREDLRRRMARSLLAEIRVCRRAHPGGEPDPALLVHHRVVRGSLAVPYGLRAPIGRRLQRCGLRGRRVRIAHRMLDLAGRIVRRVEHRDVVGAVLGRAVELAVGVDGRIAPVRRREVVHVGRLAAPVPQGQHDIPLDALWPRRLRKRQLALGDPIGPVAEILERQLRVEAADRTDHIVLCLSRLNAPRPCFRRIIEMAERGGDRARAEGADPVAGDAAGGLDNIQPCRVTLDVLRHVLVAVRAGEVALVRDVQHRKPVDRRVILRGGRRIRRRHGRQIDGLPRRRHDPRRVDESVAAHPDIVIGLGEVRNDVASLIVGDDDFGECRRQPVGLGNHPDAAFGPVFAGDHPAQIMLADADPRLSGLLRAEPRRCGSEQRSGTDHYNPLKELDFPRHRIVPPSDDRAYSQAGAGSRRSLHPDRGLGNGLSPSYAQFRAIEFPTISRAIARRAPSRSMLCKLISPTYHR